MSIFQKVYLISLLLLLICSLGSCTDKDIDSPREEETKTTDSAIVEVTDDSLGAVHFRGSSNSDGVQQSSNNLQFAADSESNFWLYIAIIVLSILTFFAAFISFYLYRNQIILVNKTDALVPREWGAYLKSVGNQMEIFGNVVGKRLDTLEERTLHSTEKIQSFETYLQLQDSLDKKDAEIKRLKNGYDNHIYRKFLYRFIRVDQTLSEILEEDEVNVEDVELIKRLMEDAFLECGVERFVPEVGEDYTRARGVDENPEKIFTQQEEKVFQIAEVKEEGYELKNSEQAEIIVPAKVKIYVNEKKG